ncbi:MAG TPA: DUF3301 domain-containing protein [Methylophaga sp.]|uniref:DUF3301 domain-containing protein n=1 Tax=unclassified Methylophaga TaxID=2629249 RepID=UPI000C8F7C91|nr:MULTISPECIES: DUF3301 domain-containing protein [unclassified Methylophaga]MAP26677.1 hypothetical protein [Methylophaga sp.]HAD31623.1 DUF3301 domain-containing protein [Methylophaga sp.]HBX61060.1 DUF3301 domain-containing protein [Methylophaga sp.]HCO01065.1 DUF3301 domain-containing protein [Methylophaga sp.]
MNDSTIVLLILAFIGWIWWDSRGVAEHASKVASQYCQSMGVSFLNDTVAWQKIRLKRGATGRVQLERTYFFEFASDMQQRYRGEIVMLGKRVKTIQLDPHRYS